MTSNEHAFESWGVRVDGSRRMAQSLAKLGHTEAAIQEYQAALQSERDFLKSEQTRGSTLAGLCSKGS
jgi:hypothetical protein